MIQPTCPYCNSNEYLDIGLINCKDLFCNSGIMASYFECKECHSWYQRELPNDISSLYNNYPIHTNKSFLFKMIRNLIGYSGYLKYPAKFFGKKINLLDYGCGDGGYLEWVKGVDDKAGFDPYTSNDKLNFDGTNKYDLITLNHVIEHLVSPYETIKLLKDRLNNNGYLLILTPNKDSFLAQKYKKLWHALDSPRHLHLASISGVEKLCNRTDLKLINLEEFAFPNDLSATFVQVLLKKYNHPLFLLFLIPFVLISKLRFKQNKSMIRVILKFESNTGEKIE